MRIAHLSDLHITDGPRIEDHAATMARIVDDVIRSRPELIVITGDLTGTTVPHRSTPREREVLFGAVRRLADAAPVLVLYGNHDSRPDLDPLVHVGGAWPVQVLDGAGDAEVLTAIGPVRVYWLAYPTTGWLLAGKPAVSAESSRVAAGEALERILDHWRLLIGQCRAEDPGSIHIGLAHVMIRGSATAGGEVLAGAEIEVTPRALEIGLDYMALGHLHLTQRMAPRAWYAGSPWRNDFGDTAASKAWLCVTLEGDAMAARRREWGVASTPSLGAFQARESPAVAGGPAVDVCAVATGARDFVTLDYDWRDGGLVRPDRLRLVDLEGAEVKARISLRSDDLAAALPSWDAETARLREVAHRLVVERAVIPVHRVRAPELTGAESLEDRLRVWAGTVEPAIPAADLDAAIARLGDV